MTTRPRVLLTRARGRNESLRRALGDRVQAIELPLLAFQAIPHTLPAADWVLLTSGTVLRFIDVAHLRGSRIAAVGPKTARAVEDIGIQADLVPSTALASALADALIAQGIAGQHVLYPRAEQVDPELEMRLRAAGARVTSLAVYRTGCPADAGRTLGQELPVDAILLASGSAARHLVQVGGAGLPVVCIGPSTESVSRELGLDVLAVADPHTAEGLAAATLKVLGV
ncbi:MAG: uroporphyrinogen-III synthase [Myxococcota bacterium]|nr:uroporphyrinogen-III synthase [Myxococcota bacterium]